MFHQYAVRLTGDRPRDRVLEELGRAGIGAAVHYPIPIHLQAAAKGWGYGPGDFPAAERLAREVLCLPVHPFLAPAEVERVAQTLLDSVS